MLIVISIPAFFLDLEQIAKLISCGNLLTYSFVSACGIALRFRQRETQTMERSPNEVYVWAYLLSSFLTAMLFAKVDNKIYGAVSAGGTLILIGVLMCIPQPNVPRRGHYRMPCVPLLPCIGIFFNFVLAAGLELETWCLFLVFLFSGIGIYLSYSISHSNLEPQNILRGALETSIVSD